MHFNPTAALKVSAKTSKTRHLKTMGHLGKLGPSRLCAAVSFLLVLHRALRAQGAVGTELLGKVLFRVFFLEWRMLGLFVSFKPKGFAGQMLVHL